MDLKNAGLKLTAARMKILQILDTIEHLSAEDIFMRLRQGKTEVSLATIYRVLAQFESSGLVVRHNFGDGSSLFELNTGEHHDHLVCIECGFIEEFVDDMIEQKQQQIADSRGFKMTDHCLYIFGLCPTCQVKI